MQLKFRHAIISVKRTTLNRKLRDLYTPNKRVAKKVTAEDLSLEGQSNLRVFINESLTRRNRHLFKLARDKKNEMGWNFAWTRNCTIFVKKDKDSESVVIRNELDIASKIA